MDADYPELPSQHDSENAKFRRNYRACLNCRVRKVKCDLGLVESPRDGKCARCLRERKDCVFVDSRRGGAGNVVTGKRRRDGPKTEPQGEVEVKRQATENVAQATPITHTPSFPRPTLPPLAQAVAPTPESTHFSTMEGALVFLAKAAGTIAKADERDNIDAHAQHAQLEGADSRAGSVSGSALSARTLAANTPTGTQRLSMPPMENAYAVRPRSRQTLAHIEYIGGPDAILSEAEAETLVGVFFANLHPFFPHIPRFLHLPQVLSGYPILLCAILTIASRYYALEDVATGGVAAAGARVPRHIEVHDRLWLYVQRLISQTVWAEASTRSIGTIFAFLLFTEWNPRAIHWRWLDYANRADDAHVGSGAAAGAADEPTGLGAMRRLYRMAWMLIGLAVRLAQDTGFMEISPKTFLATHIAEINGVMNISRRSMLLHSLSEVDLDEDDISEDQMEAAEQDDINILSMSEDDLKRILLEHILRFTVAQKAKIELLQIMLLGHESLYGYKAQLGAMTQRQNLSILNIIHPLINNWGRKYRHLLVPSSNKVVRATHNMQMHLENLESKAAQTLAGYIENESFIFEFHYAKLYIYSLALSPSPKDAKSGTQAGTKTPRSSRRVSLKLDEISKSAKYIEQAFASANEMLLVAHRVHKLKMLRFMPVRWVTRIVRAVAFIVKCYLTITAHKLASASTAAATIDNFDSTVLSLSLISSDEIMQSIQRAAITLRDCLPDELHLCTRYSNVLMYLCLEMKTKSRSNGQEGHEESDDESPNRAGYDARGASSRVDPHDAPRADDAPRATTQPGAPRGPATAHPPPQAFDPYYQHTSGASSAADTPLQNLVGDSEVMEWFINNKNIGLDFVGPWTEMIEQQLNSDVQFNFENAMT